MVLLMISILETNDRHEVRIGRAPEKRPSLSESSRSFDTRFQQTIPLWLIFGKKTVHESYGLARIKKPSSDSVFPIF